MCSLQPLQTSKSELSRLAQTSTVGVNNCPVWWSQSEPALSAHQRQQQNNPHASSPTPDPYTQTREAEDDSVYLQREGAYGDLVCVVARPLLAGAPLKRLL